MKISELINILNEYKEKYGDIKVCTGIMLRNPHIEYSKRNNIVIIKRQQED